MFTTARKSKLITNISLEHDMVGVQDKLVSKERSEDFLTGRVLALCLETFFFGFALAYFSSFNDSITTLQYT